MFGGAGLAGGGPGAEPGGQLRSVGPGGAGFEGLGTVFQYGSLGRGFGPVPHRFAVGPGD